MQTNPLSYGSIPTQVSLFGRIQTIETGGQMGTDPSPTKVRDFYLAYLKITFYWNYPTAVLARIKSTLTHFHPIWLATSVTRLGDLLDFGQLFKAFGNN